jgi:pectate lyase
MDTAINTRMGAQMLVQSNAFKNVAVPVTSRFSDEVG